jgi:hypothetical protein
MSRRFFSFCLAILLGLPAWGARDFNGTSHFADYGNPSLGLSTTYTVSIWVRTDDVASTRTFSRWGSTSAGNPFLWILGQVNSDVRFFVRDNAGTGANSTKSTVLTAGTWTHLAGTRSGNDVLIYADGVAGSGASAAISTTTVNRLTVGVAGDGGGGLTQYTDGNLAEFAIWSVTLTQAEITSLANGLSPLRVRPSALVFYVPMWTGLWEYIRNTSVTADSPAQSHFHPRRYR